MTLIYKDQKTWDRVTKILDDPEIQCKLNNPFANPWAIIGKEIFKDIFEEGLQYNFDERSKVGYEIKGRNS